MKVLLGIVVAVAASAAVGFVIGKNQGTNEGYAAASSDYNLWAVGMLHRDPNFRLDAIMLVPDGALVRVPNCDSDESMSAIAWRRPERGYRESANLQREGDRLLVKIPHDGSKEPKAAVVVGCRNKVESTEVRDLSRSWELPSNLR